MSHENFNQFRASNDASENLHFDVFADPKSFLKTLRDNFSKIDNATPDTPDLITKMELQLYAENGDDPKTRSAARIASNHFGELRELSKMPCATSPYHFLNEHVVNDRKIDAVSRDDLKVNMDMWEGRTTWYVADKLATAGLTTLLGASITALSGMTLMMAGPVTPIGIAVMGPIIVASAGFTVAEGYHAASLPGTINNLSKTNQKVFSSWPEINGAILKVN